MCSRDFHSSKVLYDFNFPSLSEILLYRNELRKVGLQDWLININAFTIITVNKNKWNSSLL